MRVFINGLLLTNRFSGVQFSIENLLLGIDKIVKHAGVEIEACLPEGYNGPLLQTSHIKLHIIKGYRGNSLHRVFWEHLIQPRLLRNLGPCILHSPGYILPYRCPVPGVVTIHDLFIFKHPSLCRKKSVIYFQSSLARTIESSKKIIAVSETVKRDILHYFDLSSEKVEVIHHGINPRFRKVIDVMILSMVRKKYKLPQEFVLFVGNIEPKKNLVNLLAAWHLLKSMKKNNPYKLVIAGQKGWMYAEVFKKYRTLGLENDVIFTGYVDSVDLPSLYSLASLLVLVSIDEGFGLPVLEAMACGVPVLASNIESLREISDGNAKFTTPNAPGEIAQKLNELLNDHELRTRLSEKGLQWSKKFTWESAAQKTIEVYRSAAPL